ncbi:MAG: hypothetical protein JSR47_23840 [Proteobacteria bacterium]|nr:hypothetical protein [Pseudomonadota bacterium]
MDRLLSPNEAKFWLLDSSAPMNSVAVVRRAGAAPVEMPRTFAVPEVRIGAHGRPRWSKSRTPGVLRHLAESSATQWLEVAQELLDVRLGTTGAPPWHAVVLAGAAHTTLVLAVNHALTDWRTSLTVAHAFLDDVHPGDLAPACEEMLPDSAYGDPDAEGLLDGWWSARAGKRWEALGPERLTAILPAPELTRVALHKFSREATERVQTRCEDEGASLNSVLAVIMRDAMGLDSVAHAVGMERFIRPAPPAGPGLAVSHVFTRLEQGEFWESARENRASLFGEIKAGAAGDALLPLPKFLLKPDTPLSYEKAVMTITGAPTVGATGAADDGSMELVVSSARGGGGILIISYDSGCLQLIAGTAGAAAEVPLEAIAERLTHA